MKRLTFPLLATVIVGGILVLTEIQSCKHDAITQNGEGPITSPNQNPPPITSLNGDTLYANDCAGCHGPLATSAKLGATVAQIQAGISTVNNMKPLSALTPAQIQAIADVLKTSTPPPPVTDGATLYANNCAGCHGPLATSTKLNATVAQIQAGISTVSQMSSMSTLTSSQIQAIASALKTTTPPPPVTDGPTLYANYCASCHGTLATSTKLNATVVQIQTGISTVSQMSSLSTLSSTQIQAIANALKTTTPPPPVTDGPTLYANYCASCHGPLATSTKLNATAAQIQTGISTVSQMSSLSTLTSTQIQAIANALVSTTPPPPVTDGATLYANYCASCHGPLATSAKLNATAAQIQTGISTVSQMSSLSTLTSTQIQAIANALVSTAPPPTDGATLYANNCAGCHGPLATSSKIGATTTRIQNAISTVSQMSSLSTLTSTQIQAIATTLQSIPMPTDGPSLYAINCASCHGPLASSRVGGSSASNIQSAIKGERQMNYLSTLTSTQIQAIAGALAGIKGGDN